MRFHLKILIKPYRLEKLTNEELANPHLIIMSVPKAAWQSRAPMLPPQREMCCCGVSQVTGMRTSAETTGGKQGATIKSQICLLSQGNLFSAALFGLQQSSND